MEKSEINEKVKTIISLLPSEYSENIVKGFLNSDYYRLKYYSHLHSFSGGE